MDSAGQGQSWKPKITPKFKLGKNGNIDLDAMIALKGILERIQENYDNSYEINKLSQKGIDIFNEWLEAE